MRFPQVRTGQRFAYQGMQYTKTGPLTASEEGSGEQRMIMRSAEVALLDAEGKPEASTKQQYTRPELEVEIQRFKTSLVSGVKAAAEDDGTLQLEQVLALIQCTQVID
ncbi:MAG: polysulfide reductase chain A [Candidatus Thiodiazotropha sp. (ex Monitilora ramsayi)]|nr:polysulfide reductase chain A [Candidatus Thiodiazotropha sp. (ex Monitilora ramsayi)]